MNAQNWLCMDCGKNTSEASSDYYMLRNRLWRMLVPRSQRHGMLCLACVERRLGRPLRTGDFRSDHDDTSDPEDGPMARADYGIIDTLSAETLQAMDAATLRFAATQPRSVRSIVISVMESPEAVPGLPDWFYIERVEQMIDSGNLVIVEQRDLLLQCTVRPAGQ